jgi:hypothetical protein
VKQQNTFLFIYFVNFVDGIGASPHIEIVYKVSVNFTGGIVANNTTTIFEIIGALSMTTFPSSVQTYGSQVLLRHVWLRSFYQHSLIQIFSVLARVRDGCVQVPLILLQTNFSYFTP